MGLLLLHGQLSALMKASINIKRGAMAGLLNVADVSIHYRQRTCHNISPATERAFISVCENKGIKNNIYTIAVSKSTLVIGLGSNAYK